MIAAGGVGGGGDEGGVERAAEALAVIDEALGRIIARELMSSGEVADLLLDVRMLLTAAPTDAS